MTEVIKTEDIVPEKEIVAELTKEELEALNLRRNIIGSKNLEKILLERELDFFLKILQSNHKLDTSKQYTINTEGKIIELKNK